MCCVGIMCVCCVSCEYKYYDDVYISSEMSVMTHG
jgi:hypothetical protein